MPVNYGSVPFAEQIAFFKNKLAIPTARWNDLQRDAHDTGFMVAGASKADLLADLKGAVGKAIEHGTTLAEFRKDFKQIVAQHGWTDFTGSDSAEGIAWRTRVIYETNLRSSYQAGRWQQIQDGKAYRPYVQYKHSHAVITPRAEHLSWNGKVLSVDDPWWQTHYPPNGFGCQCTVFALSKRDLQRLGKTGPDPAPNDGTYDWVDKKTGEIHTFPVGVQPFWDYAPGRSNANLLRTVVAKQDQASWQIARANTQSLVNSPVFQHWHDGIAKKVKMLLADKALPKTEQIANARQSIAQGERFPIAVLNDADMLLVGVELQTVVLSDDDLVKQIISREGQGFSAADYAFAQQTIEQAQIVLRDQNEYTLFIHRGDTVYMAVLQRTKSGKAVFLKSFRRSNDRDAETQLRKIQRNGGQVLKDNR